MLNNNALKFLFIILLMFCVSIKAQDITFVPQDTLLVDTLGAEIIFTMHVTNISAQDQNVYMVRTLNDLPANWQSSLCFSLCFAPFVDSIATTPDFGSSPLSPSESREISLHVFAFNNPGTANVKIKVGTFRSPNVVYNANLTAIVQPVSVEDEIESLYNFSLSQNYPNPFNPATKIRYTIPGIETSLMKSAQFVQLKVYDLLGREVATLVNEYKPAGTYEVELQSAVGSNQLVSGIYYYQLRAGEFIQTKKMILNK
jgi:hypothetical protein